MQVVSWVSFVRMMLVLLRDLVLLLALLVMQVVLWDLVLLQVVLVVS
jgi:hypothetical protein